MGEAEEIVMCSANNGQNRSNHDSLAKSNLLKQSRDFPDDSKRRVV